MTGRVDIRIFEKIAKKLKMKSQEGKTSFLVNLSETFQKFTFLGTVTSILTFLQFS